MRNQFELSRRAHSGNPLLASSWEEIWEAGPYYRRISDLLETAENYAIFAGWQIDSRLPMGGTAETLKLKILRLCEEKPTLHFYFLMWDHAYFYILERETWQGRIWDDVHSRVHFIFDNRHPFGCSHHEKVAIIDGKTAFCGGIDLCDERWDSPAHLYFDPRRSLNWRSEHHGPYHDLAVQITGPACGEVQNHIARRWRMLSSIEFPNPPTSKISGQAHEVYVSRTIASIDADPSSAFGDSTRTPIVREIEFLFKEMIRGAERQIIIEGQYYWSPEVNDALISKVLAMRGKSFTVVLVLAEIKALKSLTRMMANYQLKLLDRLQRAATSAGTRLIMGSPYVFPDPKEDEPNAPPKSVYIHSKVLVIDDKWVSIGSANFASRALRLDTEIALTLHARNEMERTHIRRLATRILDHWSISPETTPTTRVRLVPIKPQPELRRIRESLRPYEILMKFLPWKVFFDPPLPWLYLLKRRFRGIFKRQRTAAAVSIILVSLTATLITLKIAGALAPNPNDPDLDLWETACAAVLSSVWIVRIPFVLLSLLATLHWQIEFGSSSLSAIRIAISSLWVASALGYLLTRMFPTPFISLFRKSGPGWLPERLGLRRFPTLVSVMLDPRIGIRSKIAYQGLYCVPLPWLIIGSALVLPSALYLLLLLVSYLPAYLPQTVRTAIAVGTPWILGGTFAVCLVPLFRRPEKQ